MTDPDGAVRRTFAALRIPNFRRYFAGQAVSLAGTWCSLSPRAGSCSR